MSTHNAIRLLALMGLSAPAIAQDMEASLFTGTQILGGRHELYTQDHLHRPLWPSVVLGGRGSYYPLPYAGAELDLSVMPTATGGSEPDGGSALLYDVGAQVAAGPWLGDAYATVNPFVAIGPEILGVRSQVLGHDADLALRASVGVKVHIEERVRLRADLLSQWSSGFGPTTAPAHHLGLHVGVAWKLGPWPPPSVKNQVIELLNAYEDHAGAEEISALAPREELVQALVAVANDPDVPPSRRGRAVSGLAELPPEPETAQALQTIFADPEAAPYIRRKAMLSLAQAYPVEGKAAIDEALASDDLQMEWAAVNFLDHKAKSEQSEAGEAAAADAKIEEDVPHVTFVMLDPDGNPLDATQFAVTDRFGVTTEHTGRARFIDPRFTGTETWTVAAADGSCLQARMEEATTGVAAGKLEVRLSPRRDEQLALEVRDTDGKVIPGAKVLFKDGPDFCAPKESVDANVPQPIGPGTYTVFIEAEGFKLEQRALTVVAGQPATLSATLEKTQMRIGADKINTGAIFFDSGTANLQPSASGPLDELAAAMLAYEIHPVRVEGHTDNQGTPASNLSLSQRRAEAVRAYLIRKDVPADWLVAEGFGDTKPIASNDNEPGRRKNRRVEFVIVKDDAPAAEPAPTEQP